MRWGHFTGRGSNIFVSTPLRSRTAWSQTLCCLLLFYFTIAAIGIGQQTDDHRRIHRPQPRRVSRARDCAMGIFAVQPKRGDLTKRHEVIGSVLNGLLA